MDISYHYFAVKTIARAVGFPENEAQIIATYSQYIDDYDLFYPRRYSNIPDYVKQDKYDLYISGFNLVNFNPAETGFWTTFDLGTLARPSMQKFTVSAFHFIPRNAAAIGNENAVTVPATLYDGSFASNLLDEARGEYTNADGVAAKNLALMQIGMRLHTFADTYAHQLFSGYSAKCNSVIIKNVINNITGEDETAKYNSGIASWLAWLQQYLHFLPAIGHMMVGHVPDLTHLSWTMEYPLLPGAGKGTYTRSNTSEFVRAGKEIANFLCLCLGKEALAPAAWEPLAQKLAQGLLIDISDLTEEPAMVARLSAHWRSIFPDYRYSYDHTKVLDGVVSAASIEVSGGLYGAAEANGADDRTVEAAGIVFPKMSDDFYRYNVYAEDQLINLYGPHPRRTTALLEAEQSKALLIPR